MKRNTKVLRQICRAAMIAALYVALTHVAHALHLDSGAVQFRISEALCILPFFLVEAIPGLYIGCLIANFTVGCLPPDIFFGALATLLGALGTYLLRKRSHYLAPLPTVIANTLICPPVIYYCYMDQSVSPWTAIPLTALGVAVGEILSAYLCGMLFLLALKPHAKYIFR